MSGYFSHPSGGPCWTRERGYHQPQMPDHIRQIVQAPIAPRMDVMGWIKIAPKSYESADKRFRIQGRVVRHGAPEQGGETRWTLYEWDGASGKRVRIDQGRSLEYMQQVANSR